MKDMETIFIYELEHREGGTSVDVTVFARNYKEALEKVETCWGVTGMIIVKRIIEIREIESDED